jgi:hypothetical protein
VLYNSLSRTAIVLYTHLYAASRRASARPCALKSCLRTLCRRALPHAASFWWLSSTFFGGRSARRPSTCTCRRLGLRLRGESACPASQWFFLILENLFSHTADTSLTSRHSPSRKLIMGRTSRSAQEPPAPPAQDSCFSTRRRLGDFGRFRALFCLQKRPQHIAMRGASGAEPRRQTPGASPGGCGTSVAMSSNTLVHTTVTTVCRGRHRTTARPGARQPFPRSRCCRPFSLSRRGFREPLCEQTRRPRRATTYDAPGSRAGAPAGSPTPQDGCVHQRRDCFPFVILAYCARATVTCFDTSKQRTTPAAEHPHGRGRSTSVGPSTTAVPTLSRRLFGGLFQSERRPRRATSYDVPLSRTDPQLVPSTQRGGRGPSVATVFVRVRTY